MESISKSEFELKFKEWTEWISACEEEERMAFQKGRKLYNISTMGKCTVQMKILSLEEGPRLGYTYNSCLNGRQKY